MRWQSSSLALLVGANPLDELMTSFEPPTIPRFTMTNRLQLELVLMTDGALAFWVLARRRGRAVYSPFGSSLAVNQVHFTRRLIIVLYATCQH